MNDDDGRTVAVHPVTQIVRPMLAWVTEGSIAPGVRAELGRTAPAALIVMPPIGGVGIGLALAGTFEGARVFGELTVVGLESDEV